MTKLNRSVSDTRPCMMSPKKRYTNTYSFYNQCMYVLLCDMSVCVQHFQEKMKLSEQLRMAESERKTQEDKVLATLSLSLPQSYILTHQLKEERQNLTTKNEALQAELDFTQNQLATKKAQVSETTCCYTFFLEMRPPNQKSQCSSV